jgi:hypothetical protein
MSTKFRILSIGALAMHVPVGMAVHGASAQSLDEDQDAAVYILALQDSRLNGRRAATDLLVLQRQTINPRTMFDFPADIPRPAYLDPPRRLAYAGSETVTRFLQMEAERDIPRGIEGVANLTFVERSELNRFRAGDPDWSRFKARFGTSAKLIRVSRIARNQDGTVALLYISYGCGLLCGKAHFVMFKRQSGVWRIEKINLFSQS